MSKFERIYIPLLLLAIFGCLWLGIANGASLSEPFNVGFAILGLNGLAESLTGSVLVEGFICFLLLLPSPYFVFKVIRTFGSMDLSSDLARLTLYLLSTILLGLLLFPIFFFVVVSILFVNG